MNAAKLFGNILNHKETLSVLRISFFMLFYSPARKMYEKGTFFANWFTTAWDVVISKAVA